MSNGEELTNYMETQNYGGDQPPEDDATNRANFSNKLIMSIDNLLSPEFISSPEHVKKLQDMFNVYVYGKDSLDVDGHFGPKTQKALIDYRGTKRYWTVKNDVVDIDPRVTEQLYMRRKEEDELRENPPEVPLKRSSNPSDFY